jgi:hypothetical protein
MTPHHLQQSIHFQFHPLVEGQSFRMTQSRSVFQAFTVQFGGIQVEPRVVYDDRASTNSSACVLLVCSYFFSLFHLLFRLKPTKNPQNKYGVHPWHLYSKQAFGDCCLSHAQFADISTNTIKTKQVKTWGITLTTYLESSTLVVNVFTNGYIIESRQARCPP